MASKHRSHQSSIGCWTLKLDLSLFSRVQHSDITCYRKSYYRSTGVVYSTTQFTTVVVHKELGTTYDPRFSTTVTLYCGTNTTNIIRLKVYATTVSGLNTRVCGPYWSTKYVVLYKYRWNPNKHTWKCFILPVRSATESRLWKRSKVQYLVPGSRCEIRCAQYETYSCCEQPRSIP